MDTILSVAEEELVQSLRQFSSTPLPPSERVTVSEESTAVVDPISIRPAVVTSNKKQIPHLKQEAAGVVSAIPTLIQQLTFWYSLCLLATISPMMTIV